MRVCKRAFTQSVRPTAFRRSSRRSVLVCLSAAAAVTGHASELLTSRGIPWGDEGWLVVTAKLVLRRERDPGDYQQGPCDPGRDQLCLQRQLQNVASGCRAGLKSPLWQQLQNVSRLSAFLPSANQTCAILCAISSNFAQYWQYVQYLRTCMYNINVNIVHQIACNRALGQRL